MLLAYSFNFNFEEHRWFFVLFRKAVHLCCTLYMFWTVDFWQISTPSTGVGFKIALMTHQRFKPCLGLIRKSADGNSKDSQSTASALSPMLRGSANLEVSMGVTGVGGGKIGWFKHTPGAQFDGRASRASASTAVSILAHHASLFVCKYSTK